MKCLYRFALAAVLCQALVACGAEGQEEPTRLLFLSKSSGFEHGVIKASEGEEGHVQSVLKELSEMYNAEVTATKDASLVNAENLKNYDIVMFYTTGDLTQPGSDGHPPMAEDGVQDLLDWIKAGGAFMGYHCASDTFHSPADGPPTPYIEMVGGEFISHGRQFEGIVKVVDRTHASVQNIPKDWKIADEWYLFRNINKDDIHVLALMDPGPERENQEMYDIPPYPVIWCREYGEGRVYYNAMGHRPDVWDDPVFQLTVIDAAQWVLGQTELNAEPNYDEVVPEAE